MAWYAWATGDCTATSTTATSIWPLWCKTSAATTTTITATETTASTWVVWNSETGQYKVYPEPKRLTAEEQRKVDADREEYQRKFREAEAERVKKQKEADAKADELLHQHLTGRQRRSYQKGRWFRVRARDGTRFKIEHKWVGNVIELNRQGKPINRFCIHPDRNVPVADSLLAQKLLLENDPDAFRRIANRTPIAV